MFGFPTPTLVAAGAALLVIVGLLAALGFSRHDYNVVSERLAAANRTIGQLQGAIVIQNAAVDSLAAESKRRVAIGAKAIAEAHAASVEVERQIAALRAVPAPTGDVCKATDDLILESLHAAP